VALAFIDPNFDQTRSGNIRVPNAISLAVQSDIGRKIDLFPLLSTRFISSFRMMDILPQKTIVMVERY